MDAISSMLKELGLSPYEISAYLALLQKGGMSATECSAVSRVPRPRCYDVLRSLMEKGLITMEPGRPAKYYALPPEIGIKNLFKRYRERIERDLAVRERNLNFLIEELTIRYSREGSEDILNYVWITRGSFSLDIYVDFLRKTNHRFYLVTPYTSSIDSEKDFYRALLDALDRGVDVRIIQPVSGTVNFSAYKTLVERGAEIRHHLNPRGYFTLLDDCVILRMIKDRRYIATVMLRDDFTYETLLDYYDILWNESKDLNSVLEMYQRKHKFQFKLNLPRAAKINYIDLNEESYVEYYIPLGYASGFISVFWFKGRSEEPVDSLVRRYGEKIRVASLDIISIEDVKFAGHKGNLVRGRWRNIVLGTGPINYITFYCDKKDITYTVAYAVNAGEKIELEKDGMEEVEAIASTFRCH